MYWELVEASEEIWWLGAECFGGKEALTSNWVGLGEWKQSLTFPSLLLPPPGSSKFLHGSSDAYKGQQPLPPSFDCERTELFESSDHVGNLLCLWVTCCSTKTRAVVASPSLEDSSTQLDKALTELIQYLRWFHFELGVAIDDLQSSLPTGFPMVPGSRNLLVIEASLHLTLYQPHSISPLFLLRMTDACICIIP